jgi:hypothetical protein
VDCGGVLRRAGMEVQDPLSERSRENYLDL